MYKPITFFAAQDRDNKRYGVGYEKKGTPRKVKKKVTEESEKIKCPE